MMHRAVGMRGLEVPADVDAAAVGETHVEQHDVRGDGADPPQRLRRGGRLPDDGDVARGGEEHRDPAAHELVVVDQEHGDGCRWSCVRSDPDGDPPQ